MESWEFIKQGSIIRTSSGILAKFGSSFVDAYNQAVFTSPYANNIDNNIIENGIYKIDDGWRYATEEEQKHLDALYIEYLKRKLYK